MGDAATDALEQTPLHAAHVRLGGRMVPFAGFSMPVQYGSIVEEHRAVREAVGVFDVSHMGQIHLSAPGDAAVEAVERLVTCPVASLRPGRVRYGLLCNADGGVVDDVTVYRTGDGALMLCVNAANIQKDDDWIRANTPSGVSIDNRSQATGLLALQGPQSAERLAPLASGGDAAAIKRFRFAELEVAGVPALVSRTGYTGSDGYELYLPAEHATEAVWDALLEAGADRLQLAGLGARDTLRTRDAGFALYGHELDDTTTTRSTPASERFVEARGRRLHRRRGDREARRRGTHPEVRLVGPRDSSGRAEWPATGFAGLRRTPSEGRRPASVSVTSSANLRPQRRAIAHRESATLGARRSSERGTSRSPSRFASRSTRQRIVQTPFVRKPRASGSRAEPTRHRDRTEREPWRMARH